MILNKHSHCHVKIRLLLAKIESSTHTKLITNINEEFEEIRFINNLSYLIINYKEERYMTLDLKLTDDTKAIIEEIMVYLNWLDIEKIIQKKTK